MHTTLHTHTRSADNHRKHLYVDLRPYTCVFGSCSFTQEPFATRQVWSDHLELDHRLGPFWDGIQCPLCLDTMESGKSAVLIHFARHMEDIALASLPRDVESDAECESDGGSSADSNTTHEVFFEVDEELDGGRNAISHQKSSNPSWRCKVFELSLGQWLSRGIGQCSVYVSDDSKECLHIRSELDPASMLLDVEIRRRFVYHRENANCIVVQVTSGAVAIAFEKAEGCKTIYTYLQESGAAARSYPSLQEDFNPTHPILVEQVTIAADAQLAAQANRTCGLTELARHDILRDSGGSNAGGSTPIPIFLGKGPLTGIDHDDFTEQVSPFGFEEMNKQSPIEDDIQSPSLDAWFDFDISATMESFYAHQGSRGTSQDLDTRAEQQQRDDSSDTVEHLALRHPPPQKGTKSRYPVGRKKPLSPEQKREAIAMRQIGACANCKGHRLKCDSGTPCQSCLRNYKGDLVNNPCRREIRPEPIPPMQDSPLLQAHGATPSMMQTSQHQDMAPEKMKALQDQQTQRRDQQTRHEESKGGRIAVKATYHLRHQKSERVSTEVNMIRHRRASLEIC